MEVEHQFIIHTYSNRWLREGQDARRICFIWSIISNCGEEIVEMDNKLVRLGLQRSDKGLVWCSHFSDINYRPV